MTRRRTVVFGLLAVVFGSVVVTRLVAPERFDATVEWFEKLIIDAPDPIVIGGSVLLVIAVWVVAMIYAAKLLYWCWRQIDGYVLWVWNTVLPESPVVRFGVGLTLMTLVFLVGPLVVLQALDFMGDTDEPVDRQSNETTSNETATNETTTNTTESLSEETGQFEPFGAGWGPPDSNRVIRFVSYP